jgi:hypothetical protein
VPHWFEGAPFGGCQVGEAGEPGTGRIAIAVAVAIAIAIAVTATAAS